VNKEILNLSIKLGISYAQALQEVDKVISAGLASTIEEATYRIEHLT
jgi:hypothetical protein